LLAELDLQTASVLRWGLVVDLEVHLRLQVLKDHILAIGQVLLVALTHILIIAQLLRVENDEQVAAEVHDRALADVNQLLVDSADLVQEVARNQADRVGVVCGEKSDIYQFVEMKVVD